MAKLKPRPWTAADYDRAALAYCRRLPLEHFMEAIPAATQRKITVESFDLLRTQRPDVQCFNELLIQYWHNGRIRRVVPDNFIRICDRPPATETSFNLELEPVGPLLTMEYVSPSNPRKDYRQNFVKYERELKVPYYLLFYPEWQDLRLHHLEGDSYRVLTPNARGRLELGELELEVALRDRWVRFWYRGHLLELPDELQRQREQERQRAEQERQRAEQERQRAEQERQQRAAAEAEVARLRALVAELQPGKKKPRRPRNGR
jgi:Uma2 family endonuclease